LRLNLLAASVMVLGALSGAVTNRPSLGVTQQALKDLPAIVYAVAYPGGVLGIIVSLLLLRWWQRIDLAAESKACAQEMTRSHKDVSETRHFYYWLL